MTEIQSQSLSFAVELENDFPYIFEVEKDSQHLLKYTDDFFTYDVDVPEASLTESGDLNLKFSGISAFGMIDNLDFNLLFSSENTGKIQTALGDPLTGLPDQDTPGSLKEMFIKSDLDQSFRLRIGGGMTFFSPPTTLNILKNDIGLYRVFDQIVDFIFLESGILGVYFKDPYYYLVHQWIPFPNSWTSQIQDLLSILV